MALRSGHPATAARQGVRLVLSVDAIMPPLTGIGRYAWELAKRLPAAPGIGDVRYFSLGRWVSDPQALLGVPAVAQATRRVLAGSRLAQAGFRLLSPLLVGGRLRGFGDHLYHSPNFFLPAFPGRSLATFHDLSVFLHPQYHPPARVDFMRREIAKALQRADFLITVSDFTRREVIAHLGWPEERVRAVPLGVDAAYRPYTPEQTRAVLGSFGLEHGGYCLCVATIEPRKNIDGLLSAYAALPEALRRRYPLVLAGGPGWQSGQTHARMEGLARAGWLRYLGYVREEALPALFAGAHGFLFPSFYEGFGLPVLEAMASGVPVLCSGRASLPEVAGDSALIVEPEDGDALAAGIRRLIEDEVWRAAARVRARERAARFTWAATAEGTVAVYRAVAERV